MGLLDQWTNESPVEQEPAEPKSGGLLEQWSTPDGPAPVPQQSGGLLSQWESTAIPERPSPDVAYGEQRVAQKSAPQEYTIGGQWKRGQAHARMGELGFKKLTGTMTPKEINEFEGLKRFAKKPVEEPGFFEGMLGAATEMAPIMLNAIVKGQEWGLKGAMVGGVSGAAASAITGPAAPLAAPVTAASGAGMGYGVGTAYGASEYIYRIEAGLAYDEMLDRGIDPEIASYAAVGVGTVNALLELGQIGLILKTIPGGKQLAAKISNSLTNKLLQDAVTKPTVRKAVTSGAKKFTGYLAAEVGQEEGQEAAQIIGDRIATHLSNELKGTDVDQYTADEIVTRLKEVGVESLKAFFVLGAPGSVVKTGIRAKRAKKEGEIYDILTGEKPPEAPEAVGERADANQILEAAAARTETGAVPPAGPVPPGPVPPGAPIAPSAPTEGVIPEPGMTPEQIIEEAEDRRAMEAQVADTLAPSAVRMTPEEELRPRPHEAQIPGPRPAEPVFTPTFEPVYQAIPETHERQIGVTARQPVIPTKKKPLTAEQMAELPQAELDKIPTEERARALLGPEATEKEVQRLAQDAEELKATKGQADIEIAAAATDTAPTEAQIEAGNYKKGHVNIEGLDISIETPKGAIRRGIDRLGKAWKRTMRSHYGYIKGTEGGENEQLDVFLGPSRNYDTVYVVDQINPDTGQFDEHKVMVGYKSAKAAKAGYLANYEAGWKGAKQIHTMTMPAFKAWMKTMDPKKAVSDQVTITKKQWLEQPQMRPEGYSKAEYRPGATGKMEKITNATIEKEYETWADEQAKKVTIGKVTELIKLARPKVKQGDIKELSIDDVPSDRLDEFLSAQLFARAMGIKLMIIDSGDVKIAMNGYWMSAINTMAINVKNPNPIMTTLTHEVTHSMIKNNPILYKKLERYVFENTSEKSFERWKKQYLYVAERTNTKVNDNIIRYEYVAYAIGIVSTKDAFWNRMAKKDPGLFKKVSEFIIGTINRIITETGKYAAKYGDPTKPGYIHFKNINQAAIDLADMFVEAAGQTDFSKKLDEMFKEEQKSLYTAEYTAEYFFDIEEDADADTVALSAMSSLADGNNTVTFKKGKNYGARPIVESIGFVRRGNTDTYKFDERIPKDADIIAGMYQAAWHADLKTKRSTAKFFSEISERFGRLQREGLDKKEQAAAQKRVSDYLNKSWPVYRKAEEATDRGNQLPVKNVLVRPKDFESGKGRQLLVQIASDFRAEEASHIGDAYYESIYDERAGYARPSRDFWELPEWMTRMAYFMPKADVYVIRSLEEAKQFLNQAEYDNVFFSVLDTNKRFVKDIAENYSGNIVAGGYLPDGSYYKGMKNVSWMANMEEAAKKVGVPFKNGVDYRHFKGTKTIPRLEMSRGCLHKCAFCSQERSLKLATDEEIDSQIKEFKSFDYELVYLNDKTFGQAANYTQLIDIKEKIKKANPKFKGFIIQTTATQFLKMPESFLRKSGIVFVELGVETFNDKFLKSLKKPHRTASIEKATQKIRDLNMVFVPNVMVGLTGKTAPSKKTVYYRGSRTGDLIKMPERRAYYFTQNRSLAEDYGEVVRAYTVDTGKMWDNEDPKSLDPKIMRMMEKHSEFPSDEFHKGIDRYFDWAVLEDPKISAAMIKAGYDSYKTSEGGFTSIGVFDKEKVKDFKEGGDRWVEDAGTYKNTLDFFKKNRDIISHFNIGVLAAETGTELQKQLDDWQEVDTDEATMNRSWLDNKDVHEKYYYDLANMGTEQLENANLDIYVDSAYDAAGLPDIELEDYTEKIAAGGHGVLRATKREAEFVEDFRQGNSHVNSLILDAYRIAADDTDNTIGPYITFKGLRSWEEELVDELEWSKDEAVEFIEDVITRAKAAVKEPIPLITKPVREFAAEMRGRVDKGVQANLKKVAEYVGWQFEAGDRVRSKDTGKTYKITGRFWDNRNDRPMYFYEGATDKGSFIGERAHENMILLGGPIGLLDIEVDKNEGKKGSASGGLLYWDVTEIANKAGGWKKIKGFLESIDNWKGIPITPAAVKYIGNLGNNLSKDAKRRNKVKAIETFRKKLSAGTIDENSAEYKAAVKKFGAALQLFTVKRQKRFFVGKDTIYGPKQKGDITKSVKKDHALFGEFKTEITRDKNFKLVMDTPILPLDPVKRQDAIDKIFKENKKYASWYDDWNAFIKSFKHLTEDKLIKYIKMMAVFSAGSGPQGNMKMFTAIVNKLESGREVKAGSKAEGGDGVAKNDLPKIMAIWNDADPATTLEERRQIYGKKVGTYMHVGLFPRAEGVVIDRHMPRLWGYDITWSPNMEYSNFKVMPQVEREIFDDIKEAAKRNGVSTSAVQATLWYKSRTPDVEASTYKEAAALKPSEYLPGVMHAALRTESLGVGKHFKVTPMKKGEFILATKRDGSVQYNAYSRDDIGNRIYGHTDQNPYAELVYLYEAGTAPEQQLKGKPEVYTVDLDRQKIYDGIRDPLGYWGFASERLKLDPFANLTNIFANLVEATGEFDGFVVNAPVGKGRWVLMFKKAEITGVPEGVVAGISDVVASLETEFPQTIKDISAIFHGRSDKLYKKFKALKNKYAEIKEEYFKPTVARFQGATQGKHEISGMASIRGPLKAVRAMMAEFGISNIQNNVILVHTEEDADRNGSFYRFKVKKEFGSMEAVYNKIASYGLQDYNISVNTQAGSFFIEQFVLDEYSDDFVDKFSSMIEEVAEKNFPQNITYRATGEVLGDPNWTGRPAKALKYYKQNLIDYFGKKEGKVKYAKAIKEAQKYKIDISKRSDPEAALFDIAEEIGEDRDQDYGRPVEGQDVIGQFSKPGEVMFDIEEADTGESRSNMWYSQLVNMVDSKFPGKSSAKNYLSLLEGMIKKGHVKQSEVDWSGLDLWLQENKGPLTKKEVLDYLERNNLKLDETVFGGGPDATEYNRTALADEFASWVYDVYPEGVGPWEAEETDEFMLNELSQWIAEGGSLESEVKYPVVYKAMFDSKMNYEMFLEEFAEDYRSTEYQQYTVPEEGSPDYVELVITMPQREGELLDGALEALEWYMKKKGQDEILKEFLIDPQTGKEMFGEERNAKIQALRKLALYKLQKEDAPKHLIMQFRKWQMGRFKLPHWGGTGERVGVWDGIAHMRADRHQIDGKNTLFIEEIQSDWAQKGRKLGFVDLRKIAPVGYHMVKQLSGPKLAYLKKIKTEKEKAIWEKKFKEAPIIGDFVYQLYEDSTGKLVAEGFDIDDTIQKAGFNRQSFVQTSPIYLSKDWALLVLKRAVRYAAESGYEQIAWTSGEIQVKRYEEAFRKNVDAIYFNKKSGELRASKNGVLVFSKNLSSENELEDYVGKSNAEKILNKKSVPVDKNRADEFIAKKQSIYKVWQHHVDERMDEYLSKEEIDSLPESYGSREMFPSMMDYTVDDLVEKPDHWAFYVRSFIRSGLATEYADIKRELNKLEKQMEGVSTVLVDVKDGDIIIEGDEVVVDSKGMRGFYDDIVPSAFKRFFSKKKWGNPKVTKTNIIVGEVRAATWKDADTVLITGKDGMIGSVQWRTAAEIYLDGDTIYRAVSDFAPMEDRVKGLTGDTIIFDLKQYWENRGIPMGYKSMSDYLIGMVLPALNQQLGSGALKEDVWAAPITDEMRQKAMDEGFPMFDIEEEDIPSEAGAVLEEKIGRQPRKLSTKIVESVTDYMENWQTNMVDKMHPIKNWFGELSNAYMMHRGLPGVQSTLNAFMEHGKLEMRDDGSIITSEVGSGFTKWLEGLGQDAEKFLYWQIAKRSEVLKGEDREMLLTNDDRKKIYAWVGEKPKNRDSWKEISDEFAEWNQSMLDIAVQSGLITKEQMKGWQTEYYIPFYRIFEDEATKMEFVRGPAKGKKFISASIKRLRGSEKRMGDPMENIIKNWSSLLTNSMANRARRETYEYAEENKLKTGRMRINEDGTEEAEPLLEQIPWSKTVIFKPVGKGGPTFVQEKTGEPVLAFKDGGKSVFFKVNDPELFGALSGVNKEYFDNVLMSFMSGSKRLLTLGATITPAFRIANMLRDTLHTFQISKDFMPFIDTARGFMKIWKNDPAYAEFMASGHAFGGSYVRADNPNALKKYTDKIVKREGAGSRKRILDTASKMWDFWEAVGEASENAARVQLYSNLKQKGKTHMEAAFRARDLMDFQMSGASNIVQFFIQTVPFLNARVQGLYKMGRSLVEDPKSFMVKGALISTASLALWLLYWDDDRYKELEDWEKWAYYHFWIGDAHFRIPKPFETGVIFSSSVEAAANVMSGNDEIEHIFNYLKHAFLETFAFNPVPQVVRPAAEIYMNKSFFTGRPIESMSQKRLRPGERYDPWDSETLRLLGSKLNISPKKAKTLIRGYTASLGMGILAASDLLVRNIADFPERPSMDIGQYPAIGRFVKGKVSRYTKHMSKFYDLYNEVDELVGTVNNYKRTGQFEKARELVKANRKKLAMRKGLGGARKRLGDISLEMRKVWYSRTMTSEQKYKRLQDLTKKRNKIVRDIYDKYLNK